MNKENIFSKLGSKDYNNQLEKILENKDFSENVKNLLLSMLYRIQVGYDDYTTVKRIVENKKDYIEEILQIIKALKIKAFLIFYIILLIRAFFSYPRRRVFESPSRYQD